MFVQLTLHLILHDVCRLKARKFQLVVQKTFPSHYVEPTSSFSSSTLPSSSSSSDCTIQPSSSAASPPQSMSLLESCPSRDGYFDGDVESIRRELQGSDLKHVLAVLNEVWTREVSTTGAFSVSLEADPGE